MTEIRIPRMGLVLLVGVTGSGKSTFARKHFRPTEVVSSDVCRGLVADDENDQSATVDAFDVLHYIAGTRLRRGLLTVVDATNVQPAARASLIRLARDHDVLADAIVLDVPEQVAVHRDAERTGGHGARVVARQHRDLHRSLRRMAKEGFRRVHVLAGVEQIDAARIVREPSWNDRGELTGPFDIIGDVHGCAAELRTLLGELGWRVDADTASHPDGRTAVFVGDLVDRGPDTPGVLRLVMGMVEAGTALCVSGNHEAKLVRALQGKGGRTSHGLARSLAQLDAEPDEFRTAAQRFMERLISHYVLDGGRLVVAHAGLPEKYHGRSSSRVRAFALYGDTTGETDEYGLPVRYPWANDYRGAATVVYGHTPVPTAEWVNNTICLDTGAVFGGALTALRYPERDLVSVPAEREWCPPVKPLGASGATGPQHVPDREPAVLRIGDVTGTRWLNTELAGRVKIEEQQAAAALEVMSRFAVDPRWLIHLPPTMSPATSSTLDGFLEHPERAFADYAAAGVTRVVCEEKHMGSRAVVVLARDAAVAERRFGVDDGATGAVYSRTGRPLRAAGLLDRIRDAVAPLWTELDTDWLALDCELLPWTAQARELIQDRFAAVAAAGTTALPEVSAALELAAARGLDVAGLRARTDARLDRVLAFRDAYRAYCRPDDMPITVAPFQILAAEGRVLARTEGHEWHLDRLGALAGDVLTPTRYRVVDLSSATERAAATDWWLELTASGAEGMVVKPAAPPTRKVQPGLKIRGREYLRIVYGPDYTDALDVLRERNLGRKRQLALREYALGLDALSGFVAGEPLWRVHERVFAVLALESDPVDPRL